MICSKCGNQVADNATFCPVCGNPIAAPQAPQAQPQAPQYAQAPQYNQAPQYPQQGQYAPTPTPAAPLPPILKNFIENLKAFFLSRKPVAAVANSARGTDLSGAILALFIILLQPLCVMVNFNQIFARLADMDDFSISGMLLVGILLSVKESAILTGRFPDAEGGGAMYGMSILAMAMIFIAIVTMLFVVGNYLFKKPITIAGALNIAAYGLLPFFISSLVGMIFGLFWLPLTFICNVIAAAMSFYIIYHAMCDVCQADGKKTLPYMIFFTVIFLTLILFTFIALTVVGNAIEG